MQNLHLSFEIIANSVLKRPSWVKSKLSEAKKAFKQKQLYAETFLLIRRLHFTPSTLDCSDITTCIYIFKSEFSTYLSEIEAAMQLFGPYIPASILQYVLPTEISKLTQKHQHLQQLFNPCNLENKLSASQLLLAPVEAVVSEVCRLSARTLLLERRATAELFKCHFFPCWQHNKGKSICIHFAIVGEMQ